MKPSESIVDAIMNQMPAHADKYLSDTGVSGFVLSIHWKLNNDPKRPNKDSKTITIYIPEELLEDFPNYPPHMQQSALEKLKKFIAQKLKYFEPDHSASRYEQPPVEKWSIPLEQLFG